MCYHTGWLEPLVRCWQCECVKCVSGGGVSGAGTQKTRSPATCHSEAGWRLGWSWSWQGQEQLMCVCAVSLPCQHCDRFCYNVLFCVQSFFMYFLSLSNRFTDISIYWRSFLGISCHLFLVSFEYFVIIVARSRDSGFILISQFFYHVCSVGGN